MLLSIRRPSYVPSQLKKKMSCYEEELYSFIPPGFLEDVVDGVYFITMPTNCELWFFKYLGRALHSKLHIHYSSGCKTGLKSQLFDRSDLLASIFRSALIRGHNRILVLEDSCFFDDFSMEDIKSIGEFIQNCDVDVYNLGTLPLIGFPAEWKHLRVFCMSWANSVIYCNPKYMQDFLAAMDEKSLPRTTDTFWNVARYKKYQYHRQICFQPFPRMFGVWGCSSMSSLTRHFGLHRYHKNTTRLLSLCVLGSAIIALLHCGSQ